MFIPLSWIPVLLVTAVILVLMKRDLEDGGWGAGIGTLFLAGPLGLAWAIHFAVLWFMGW